MYAQLKCQVKLELSNQKLEDLNTREVQLQSSFFNLSYANPLTFNTYYSQVFNSTINTQYTQSVLEVDT